MPGTRPSATQDLVGGHVTAVVERGRHLPVAPDADHLGLGQHGDPLGLEGGLELVAAEGLLPREEAGAASTTVTWLPKRRKAWAISTPIAPPPRTRRRGGISLASVISLFVQGRDPARPSIPAGTAGPLPTAATIPRRAVRCLTPPPTSSTVT